jgi:hypothetical protein
MLSYKPDRVPALVYPYSGFPIDGRLLLLRDFSLATFQTESFLLFTALPTIIDLFLYPANERLHK